MSNESPLEKLLKEATSNTNWGCSTTILGDIARASHDYHDFFIIMKHVWESLSSKSKYWRKIFKTLALLEYLLRHGSERVNDELRDCMFRIRSLTGFHVTEDGHDRGGGIREKAKQILDLASNPELLREEREKARANRDRYVGMSARGDIIGPAGTIGFQPRLTAGPNTAIRNSEHRPPIVEDTTRGSLKAIKEREQKRVETERENARREREERQKKAFQAKQSSDLLSSDDVTRVVTTESSDSKNRSKHRHKKHDQKKIDDFNTDALWGDPGSTEKVKSQLPVQPQDFPSLLTPVTGSEATAPLSQLQFSLPPPPPAATATQMYPAALPTRPLAPVPPAETARVTAPYNSLYQPHEVYSGALSVAQTTVPSSMVNNPNQLVEGGPSLCLEPLGLLSSSHLAPICPTAPTPRPLLTHNTLPSDRSVTVGQLHQVSSDEGVARSQLDQTLVQSLMAKNLEGLASLCPTRPHQI